MDLQGVHSWGGDNSVELCGGINSAMRSLAGDQDPENGNRSMSSWVLARRLNLNPRRRRCNEQVVIVMVTFYAHNSTTLTPRLPFFAPGQLPHQQSGQQNLRGPLSSLLHYQLRDPFLQLPRVHR